ncbi:MAG: alpha/beta hydrolase-fold protein [Hyphomonas sp.]|uniref:alpha/beta hydrolase-fold protein n=1 Tax=Hyphomonas sp. TaxID=87 RepID=UPI00352734A2
MNRAFAAFLALVFASVCGSPAADAPVPDGMERVQIAAEVPATAGKVYLTGSLDSLGPWKADALLMEGEGAERHVSLLRPAGHDFEYKFTLGSWEHEGLGPSGTVMGNFVLPAGETSAHQTIVDFKKDVRDYIADVEHAGIIGHLDYWLDVESAFLSEPRHVSIWTPPGYADDPKKSYRVIYMSDGQNLFDPRIANTGTDWGADEAMAALAEQGFEPAIIVSSWSTSKRFEEYSPWHQGEDYARFLIEELMPRVEAAYRVKTGPENTIHVGSSMGGLISFYLVTHHPDVFGACGCVSTHFPLSEAVVKQVFPNIRIGPEPDDAPYLVRDIEAGLTPPAGARYWFDYGTEGLDAEYGPTHEILHEWLIASGLTEGRDFVIRRYDGATHNEASWRARLPDIFAFLLAPATETETQ